MASSTIAPGFLVAAPSLRCPFFHHTVVLMVDHGEEGSFGFVVNKASPLGFPQVLEELEIEDEQGVGARVPVLRGGPVSPESGWVIFDPSGAPEIPEETIPLGPDLAVTASLDMMRVIGAGHVPPKCMMALGYAGWSAGQLESEMKSGSWIPVDIDAGVLFETALDERWETALRALGIDPARVVTRDQAQA